MTTRAPFEKFAGIAALVVIVVAIGFQWFDTFTMQDLELPARIKMWLPLAAETGCAGMLFWLLLRARKSSESLERQMVHATKLLAQQLQQSPANLTTERPQDVGNLERVINTASVELAELRRKQKLIIDRAVDVICVVDTDSKFVSINQACEKAWGYGRNELIGLPVTTVLPVPEGEVSGGFSGQILGAAKSIDKVSFESKLRCKDGRLLDVMWTGHWSASEGGLFCIIHDITAQKMIEQTIRNSEQRLRLTLEALPAGVLVCDANGTVEFANRAAATMLNCAATAVSGGQLSQYLADEMDLSKLSAQAEAGLNTMARQAGGTSLPIEVWGSKIQMTDASKNLIVFLDKTADYELERVKREFLAMVTHDIRSPLTAVEGILTLMEQGVLGEVSDRGRQMAERAHKECDRMLRLLNDMLEAEKIESGSFPIECTEIPMDATVRDAVESVRQTALAKSVDINAQLESISCWGDHQRIVQVVVNLLTNAVKYSPENTTITVSLYTADDFAVVCVADQGRGIPADKVDSIFKKFEQVDASDSKEKRGIGLGLAICKAIIEQHGGKIGVESKPGAGSRFWFTIPRSVAVAGQRQRV